MRILDGIPKSVNNLLLVYDPKNKYCNYHSLFRFNVSIGMVKPLVKIVIISNTSQAQTACGDHHLNQLNLVGFMDCRKITEKP